MRPFEELIKDFSGGPGAIDQILKNAEETLQVTLPTDYRDFLKRFNGGEGFVGKHYLILWKVEDLRQLNRDYQVNDYAPGLLCFGTDGGGEGFAFDTRLSPYLVSRCHS